jgi:hypothetical protein
MVRNQEGHGLLAGRLVAVREVRRAYAERAESAERADVSDKLEMEKRAAAKIRGLVAVVELAAETDSEWDRQRRIGALALTLIEAALSDTTRTPGARVAAAWTVAQEALARLPKDIPPPNQDPPAAAPRET